MTALDFEPIGDRVIVLPEIEEIKTNSGIIIVQNDVNKELPGKGKIVALGDGGTFPDCPNPKKFLKVGDMVYFNKYAGEDFSIQVVKGEKTELKVLRLDAIFGKINNVK